MKPLCTTAAALLITLSAAAQQPGPAFDVISIKPNNSASGHEHLHTSSENADLKTENTGFDTLLEFAYGIKRMQIVGISPALASAHFDVEAKADPATNAQASKMESKALDTLTKTMARQMLADRFGVVAHREQRELPAYLLVPAKGGPKLKTSDVSGTHVTGRHGTLTATGISAYELAAELADNVNRVVVDKTGLTGRYELTLRWMPEDGRAPLLNGEPDTSLPSIFTAVQEQLGLKLEPQKASVEVLVIDQAHLPDAN